MFMNATKAFQFCFFIAFQVPTRFLISLFKLAQQKCKCCISPNPFVKTSLFNLELISFMHTSSSIISTKSICKKLGGGGGEEERKQRTSRRKSHNKISNKFLEDRKAILKHPEDRAILAKKQSPATSFC
jgi:hypothetical protein